MGVSAVTLTMSEEKYESFLPLVSSSWNPMLQFFGGGDGGGTKIWTQGLYLQSRHYTV
jgi:hypothetical protein